MTIHRDRSRRDYIFGFSYHGLHASVVADLLSRRRDPHDAAMLKSLVHDELFYRQCGILISYLRLDLAAISRPLGGDDFLITPTINRLFLKEKTAGAWFQQLYLHEAWEQSNAALAFAEAHPHFDEDAWNEILCFALRSPERGAREFLDRQRRSNPKRLAAIEEHLQMLEPVLDEKSRP